MQNNQGFTLIELLITVAIMGILAAVAIPAYQGHVDTAKGNTAQNNLRNIYLQQQEYITDNAVYYSTSTSCGDYASDINTNLFAGQSILSNDVYNYCILQTTTTDFTAHAQLISDPTVDYTITNNNIVNF